MAADLPEGRRALREPGIHLRQPGKLGKGIGGSPRGDAPGTERRDQLCQSRRRSYTSLNRLDEAEAVYKQAEERKLESETCSRTATCWLF